MRRLEDAADAPQFEISQLNERLRQESERYAQLKRDLQRSNDNKAEVEEKCQKAQAELDKLYAKRDKYRKEKRKNFEYIGKIRAQEKESIELVNLNNWLNQRVQNLESQIAVKDLQIEELDSQSKAASEFDKQNMSSLTGNLHENFANSNILCRQSSFGGGIQPPTSITNYNNHTAALNRKNSSMLNNQVLLQSNKPLAYELPTSEQSLNLNQNQRLPFKRILSLDHQTHH